MPPPCNKSTDDAVYSAANTCRCFLFYEKFTGDVASSRSLLSCCYWPVELPPHTSERYYTTLYRVGILSLYSTASKKCVVCCPGQSCSFSSDRRSMNTVLSRPNRHSSPLTHSFFATAHLSAPAKECSIQAMMYHIHRDKVVLLLSFKLFVRFRRINRLL